jgi:hypothetical protein
MSGFADFAAAIRTVSFSSDGIGAEFAGRELAKFAREQLDETIASGAGSPIYDLYVNDRPAVSEDEVEMAGSILYVFSWWGDIIATALEELIKRSPKKSGRYASSFVVLVDGHVVAPGSPISASAEVIITNVQPYTRKVEVGGMVMNVPPRVFDRAKRGIDRRVGGRKRGVFTQVKFLDLPAGIHPLVPYQLRGQYDGRRNAYVASVRNNTRQAGGVKIHRRKALSAGEPITYPALVINLER